MLYCKMARHHELGRAGENKAAEYLVQEGYVILERNWRLKHKELDIICQKDGLLVVVEVKTRELPEERPGELLDFRKRRSICRAADAYIKVRKLNMEVRFDLILLTGSGMTVCHIPDIIRIFDE